MKYRLITTAVLLLALASAAFLVAEDTIPPSTATPTTSPDNNALKNLNIN